MKRRLVGVWLLGLAALWWGLPPAPRHVLAVPAGWAALGVAGNGLMVAHRGGELAAWELATGRRAWRDAGTGHFVHIEYDRCVELVSVDGRPYLDARTGRRAGPSADGPRAVPSADGRFVARHQADGRLTVTDAEGAVVWARAATAEPAAVSSDGRRVLAGDGTLWAAGRDDPLWRHPNPEPFQAVMTDDGRWLVCVLPCGTLTGCLTDELRWLDAATGVEDVSRRRPLRDLYAGRLAPARPRFDGDHMAGRLVQLSAIPDPGPPAWVRWLPGWLRPNGSWSYRSWFFDPTTGSMAAGLPAGWMYQGQLDDGRLAAQSFDGPFAVWDVPPRPSRRSVVVFALGWTAAVRVIARFTRRRIPS